MRDELRKRAEKASERVSGRGCYSDTLVGAGINRRGKG